MDEFETFPEFLNRTREAEPGALVVPEVAGRAAEPVAPAAFEEMKAHVLSLYVDVPVEHSFVAPDGQYVDCVPIDRQPGLRRAGEPLATPATPPAAPAIPYSAEPTVGGQEQRPLSPPLAAGGEDAFGNTQSCPPGTIPVRRVTLEEIGRFGSLERFFKKVPRVQTAGPPVPAAAAVLHRYAHAFQTIDNFGGISNLNFWMPAPTTDDFSLSQHWYVGGAGGGLQTVEGGWQVYPWKYSTPNPVLFIYWTADGYGSTGAYNLDAPGFVQTDASWVLGGGLSPTSIAGGTQYEFTLAWERNAADGNWWLFLGSSASVVPIGYYPGSLYGVGQLSQFAQSIDYGGEVTGAPAGQMGSGAFASAGSGQCAYHSDIRYLDAVANAWLDAALTPSESDSSCYTIEVLNNWNGRPSTSFFFGGPGCP